MLFNSIEFLVFLPTVFLLYWLVLKERRWQNLLIVAASYLFYGWWDWRFLILIAFTSFCSFLSGLLLERSASAPKVRRAISISNILINLAILVLFKYYNFFSESLSDLLSLLFDYTPGWVTLNVVLPVGISFYTFQALSYSIDVYRNRINATHDAAGFFAYISFFPQLVAGPIERASNLLPQFQTDRSFDYAEAVDGMRRMLWGFFKKLVIADNCALVVNEYWNQYQELPGSMLIILAVLFTFQIYCDFSGYSDIAIGCARLFGIRLMQNFDYPYFSRSIPEFWRKWHISLTSWLRDYLYFPLGGSRCSKLKTVRNVFIVWMVSGLWHGANWTFVCWGLFHAALLSIYIAFGINTKYEHEVGHGRVLPSLKDLLRMCVSFILVAAGWVVFRCETIHQAVGFFRSMFTNSFIDAAPLHGKKMLVVCLLLLVVEWLQRDKEHVLQFPDCKPFNIRLVRRTVYYLLIILIILFIGTGQKFVYFQF